MGQRASHGMWPGQLPAPWGEVQGAGVSHLLNSAEANFAVVRNTPHIPAAARFITSCPVAADSPLKKRA